MASLTSSSHSFQSEFSSAILRLDTLGFADALWSRNLEVWRGDATVRDKIANRLGWLGALDLVEPALPRLREFAHSIRTSGLTDVVLLGMGGSSLGPEVLRQVLGVTPGFPRFRMLDSVDPDAVRAALSTSATSLFVLASKSGTTIEPNVMAAEAKRRLIADGVTTWSSRFVAITDENTALHRRAVDEQFRDVFVNPADIGGRYSVLSFFGMVPAALMGVDLDRLVAAARTMEQLCRRPSSEDNPGLHLGAFMAAGARAGRDKLTLLVPPRLASLGLWVEQLVAESTGKLGKGVVPITGEARPAARSDDRVFVALSLGDDTPAAPFLDAASQAPVLPLHMSSADEIGAEFLRWEIATATAGALLDINPFDEPNVTEAKDAARTLLDLYQQQQRLPVPEPDAEHDGARLSLSNAAREGLGGQPATAFLSLLGDGDYCGLLAYLPPDDAHLADPLEALRASVAQSGCATMFGYGPRYLHSTGQLHKGGADNGVFIVIIAAADEDLTVPGEAFSFGVLEMAQAIGDFQSLDRAGRRALFVSLPSRDAERLAALNATLLSALAGGR